MRAQIEAARLDLAARPDDLRALFTLAALLLRAGDPDAASLLPRLERHGEFVGGWLAIADALLARGRIEASLAAVGRAIRALPTAGAGGLQGARAHHLQARVLRAAGRDEDAAAALARAVSTGAAPAEIWFSLGLLRQDQHDDAGATAAYRAALRMRPDFHEAALNLGVALGETGQIEAALDAYAQAWRLRPDSFGRIAQSLVSGRAGLLFLDPAALRACLDGRERLDCRDAAVGVT
ncbi:tetratricopeptide repeat protein [Lichenicola sp.]|uniref:tetratricopeptide repeat protein n=1 Tax=Lichenicola sp. TaxID=2804529 RepID=UPI003AFF8FE7